MTRPRPPRPDPVAQPWGQGRLLVLFALGLATTIALAAGLLFTIRATITPTADDAPPATHTEARPGEGEQARRDELAAAGMVSVNPDDAWRGTPAATPGPVIQVPASTLIGPARVPSGFPRTPEGAVGQLAEIEVAVLTEMSVARAGEIHAAWSIPDAPPVERWPLMGHVRSFLSTARMGSVKDPGTTVTVTPAAAQVKATDGPDWVVACVLSEVRAVINVEARMGFGYCERMQWDGTRWLIAPGEPPAAAPSTWPDTDLAFAAGWRTWAPTGR
ncbi:MULTISPECIES: hypothetical protein [Propionibacteriales]|uniref:hypothetical protein n=1 Tax=Propionibacteriales TaxID=85009 RepID=UPI002B21C65A|nr:MULTISPECIES: hypothetical protein [Propionibacteriales]MEA4945846.1 hypothetical protein [Propionicimonas sp.]MEA5055310.1 hypothetical protein [Propionicimonas sp.]MEA5155655.1 hypothetical protein [Raineyella sp.]